MTLLPDQAHIERIKNALWQGGEFGRAAVMVGAGLSMNARPLSASAPGFPTWSVLTGRMVDDLYPKHLDAGESRKNALDQSASTSGSLRLADEYQAAFGRDALDHLMQAAIPDLRYEPWRFIRFFLSSPGPTYSQPIMTRFLNGQPATSSNENMTLSGPSRTYPAPTGPESLSFTAVFRPTGRS